MSTQRFSHTQYPINSLVEQIDSGELSLPDLQRPFVWNRSRVRDLFDSLYHGYPAGYFLFWSTPAAVDSHSVATAGGKSQVLKMIVDGQQRLTSLYAVLKAKDVVTEDNELQPMRISFNPFTEEFAVADAARANDPEWLTSISDLWNSPKGEYGFISSFIKSVRENRGLSDDEEQLVGERLGHLAGVKNYQFSALELSADLDIDDVAEVFVRINSAGIDLNSADFILTLMSVHVKEARHELEDFARQAKVPSTKGASPYNHFHAPSPDQLLRVAVGLGLKRGVLQNAYQALRGRDPKTKEVSEERRAEQFAKLLAAQEHVLDLTNWADYMVAVKRAGYRSGDMLTSKNNFLYCYLFFLIGRHEYGVGKSELREAIARWFFMASLTGRYTGSPETILEADLRRFADAETADDFVAVLDGVIDTQLTSDYWNVTLPDLLDIRGVESLPLRVLRQPQPARCQGAVLEHEDQRAVRPGREADQESRRATPPLPEGLLVLDRDHRDDSHEPDLQLRVRRVGRQHRHLRYQSGRVLPRSLRQAATERPGAGPVLARPPCRVGADGVLRVPP